MTVLSLRNARLSVEIDPDAGGSLRCLRVDGHDLLRPGSGTQGACYPLVPFSNRIANGRFEFDGREIVVAANWPGQRHPMHGDGWAAVWQVERQQPAAATISFVHDGKSGWPFRYRAVQEYRLQADFLAVRLSLENREKQPAPGGIGLHPFFVRDADILLSFRAQAVWLADPEVLPISRVSLPPHWDFADGRRSDEVVLDNCFDGWDGRATMTWPSRKLRLQLVASEPFRHAVVFTPPGRPFFCVEPVSHANGQIARTRIDPGATLSGEVLFQLIDL